MITTYNKHTELISEILIDGKSGEVIARVMPPTSYKQYYKSGKYSDFHYSIGSRQLELTYVGEDTTYALFENGKNILPDDLLVYRDSGIYFGNTLILSGYRKDLDDTNNEILVVLRPDGKDTILTIPNRNYYTGTDEYIFYSQNNDIWCLALAYGTTWELEQYTDTAVDFYSISANSNYLYSCAPWKAGHECWRIEYDTSGKPAGITLIDDNILE